METDGRINLSARKFTSRMIVEAALARGWNITGFESNSALFILQIPGKSPIKIYSSTPHTASHASVRMTDDKFIASQLLKQKGLPVPEEILLDSSQLDQAAIRKKVEKFISKHELVVVKPLDAGHGRGVSLNVDHSNVNEAVKSAAKHSGGGHVLIQEQLQGYDIRVVCIGYEFVEAMTRIPASVIGDGINNVAKLIKLTNQNPDRGVNYQKKLNKIPLKSASVYLGPEGMLQVPPAGKKVRVIGVSNTGMGGERKNVSKAIPDFIRQYALRAAKTLELPVCGVDFLVANEPARRSTEDELKPVIIEVNASPGFGMYEDVESESQKIIVEKYLDYLARH